MSLIKVTVTLMIISLVQVEASPALLERLLQSHLKTATCQARCATVSSEEMENCLEICGLPEPSLTKICQQERFCTGGCRAACTTDRQEEIMLGSVSQQDCLLTWDLQLPQSQHSSLVFLVAGQDQAGMISLVADLVVETSLELSPAVTNKYSQLTVLAVDRRGLTDTKTLTLQAVSHCADPLSLTEQSLPAQEDEDEVTVEKIENTSYQAAVYIAVTVSLLILTIFNVATILYRRNTRNGKSIEEVNTSNANSQVDVTQCLSQKSRGFLV